MSFEEHGRMRKRSQDNLAFSGLSVRLTVILLAQGYTHVSELSRVSDKGLLSLDRIGLDDLRVIRAEIARIQRRNGPLTVH